MFSVLSTLPYCYKEVEDRKEFGGRVMITGDVGEV
jgi:hypothetical protein